MQELVAVPAFCLAFFVLGYCLGRLRGDRPLWFELEPDPLRDSTEVVELDAWRRRKTLRRAS
jgi:hypothetical protein